MSKNYERKIRNCTALRELTDVLREIKQDNAVNRTEAIYLTSLLRQRGREIKKLRGDLN